MQCNSCRLFIIGQLNPLIAIQTQVHRPKWMITISALIIPCAATRCPQFSSRRQEESVLNISMMGFFHILIKAAFRNEREIYLSNVDAPWTRDLHHSIQGTRPSKSFQRQPEGDFSPELSLTGILRSMASFNNLVLSCSFPRVFMTWDILYVARAKCRSAPKVIWSVVLIHSSSSGLRHFQISKMLLKSVDHTQELTLPSVGYFLSHGDKQLGTRSRSTWYDEEGAVGSRERPKQGLGIPHIFLVQV